MRTATETPEERELAKKRIELTALEERISELQLELATLQAEIRAFEARYFQAVGRLFSEVDELQAQLAEAHARQNPNDRERGRRAVEARERATATAEAVNSMIVPVPEFRPTNDLRTLYRRLAKLVHPDLATNEHERERRHRIMAEANRAYARGDEARLRALLDEWQLSPESVSGDGIGQDLVRILRRIYQLERRLSTIDAEIEQVKRSDLFAMKERVDAASEVGQDLLAQMAAQLRTEADNLRHALRTQATL